MSNLIFPRLRGVGWDTKIAPQWDTGRSPAKSGREVTIQYRSQPRTKITLQFEFLRDSDPVAADDGSVVYTDFDTMLGFFNQHGGAAQSFYFQGVNGIDLAKYSLIEETIGTGDGATTDFQLQRDVGGWQEFIYYPQGTPVLYVDGVETGATDQGKGVFRFASAPANGALVTADFTFAYRCRFDEDAIEFSNFSAYFWDCQTVPLITVKP